MPQTIHIRLLGGLTFERDGEPITKPPNRVGQALLVYLLHQTQPVSRERLAHIFFQAAAPSQARANLRATLSRIKQRIGPLLLANRVEVWVDRDIDVWIDGQAFEEGGKQLTLRQAHDGAGKGEQKTVNVGDDSRLAYYKGDFLAGFYLRDAPEFEQWMIAERERLRLLAIAAFGQAVDRLRQAGRDTEALESVNRLLAIEPLLDGAHLSKMELLVATGNRGAALRHYEEATELFRRELSSEVSAELTAYYRQLNTQSSQPTCHKPLATYLIGRSAEITQITNHLADPDCRLLTLVGLGGSGKTAVASAVQPQLAARFADGATFIDLVGSTDMLQSIAEALNLSLTGDSPAEEQIASYLANRQQLLILDNCEELLDSAMMLQAVLDAATDCKMLATSRETFNLPEEWVIDITGLPLEDAARLFITKAQQADSRFVPSADDQLAIEKIASQVGGHPLSLVLAASWLRIVSCSEISNELGRSNDLLVDDDQRMPERQHSLNTVLTYSWQTLSPGERQTLVGLTAFRAGFDRDAAQQVGGASLIDLLRLVQRSLLQRRGDRFILHEAIRQFVAAKADSDAAFDTKALSASHAAFFAERGREWRMMLETSKEVEANVAFSAEYENIRIAWLYAVSTRNDDIIRALYYQLTLWSEAGARFDSCGALLEVAIEAVSDKCLRHTLTMFYAWLRASGGHFASAEQLIAATLPLMDGCDPLDKGYASLLSGLVQFSTRNFSAATPYLEKALAIFRTEKHDRGIARTLIELTLCLGLTGAGNETISRYAKEALHYSEALGWVAGQIGALRQLGASYYRQGNRGSANASVMRALRLAEAANMLRACAGLWNTVASFYFGNQEFDAAADAYKRSAEMCRSLGLDRHVYVNEQNVATCYTRLGRYHEARPLFEAVIAQTSGVAQEQLMASHADLATIAVEFDELALAHHHLQAALRLTLDNTLSVSFLGIVATAAAHYLIATEQWLLAARLVHTYDVEQKRQPLATWSSDQFFAKIPSDVVASAGAAEDFGAISAEILAFLNSSTP